MFIEIYKYTYILFITKNNITFEYITSNKNLKMNRQYPDSN